MNIERKFANPVILEEKENHWVSIFLTIFALVVLILTWNDRFGFIGILVFCVFASALFMKVRRRIVINYEHREILLYARRLWGEKLDDVIAFDKVQSFVIDANSNEDGDYHIPYLIGKSGQRYALLIGRMPSQKEAERIVSSMREAFKTSKV